MTTHSTLEIAGVVAPLTSTGLSAAISPDQFALACKEIVQRQSGDAAHRELDQFVTELLTSLGYGEGMAVFIAGVAPYHSEVSA